MRKKLTVVQISVLFLSAIVFGLPMIVSANSPELFEFDTWEGKESTSVSIEADYSKFEKLLYNEDEVIPLNYTVSGTDSSTIITLKEDYLKTLPNGQHSLLAYFSADGLESFITGMVDNTKKQIIFSGTPDHYKLIRLTYGDTEIDKSNYTATNNGCSTKIVFKDDYMETLSEEFIFGGYFSYEHYMVVLNLEVDTSTDNTSESVTEAVTDITVASKDTYSTTTTSNFAKSPKTGYNHSLSIGFILVLSLSLLTIIALISYNTKQHN